MTQEARPSVIAQPLAEREWQVVAGEWQRSNGGRIVGFIEELGGTYEVEVLRDSSLCQFFGTFKEAMDYFDLLEHGPQEPEILEAGALC